MVTSAQVLELVKTKGPVIPSDLNSELKTDTFLVGALLSELLGAKEIKISHAKIGGSPVYYTDEQRPKLERLYENLNQKDKRAYDLLKKEIVLLDETLDPLLKTCMRELKDFASPVKVKYKEKVLLFWKWHLGEEKEVKKKIRSLLSEIFPKEQKEVPEKVEEKFEKVSEKEIENIEPKEKEEVKNKKKDEPEEKPNIEVKVERKEIKEKSQEKNKTLDNVKENTEKIKQEVKDLWLDEIKKYFDKIGINIKEFEIIKKKKEIDLIIESPSAMGNLNFYCKAKNKKRSSEGDIASAFLEGQLKNLPPAYLSKGDVPKKVQPLLNTKFKGIKILKWELQ